ncbi:DEAD/DEAH box helicase, partial [Candidatus Latescibacteria bacterium]|nr:DEAD/DEAH box helicase [Candidatus Latescibacterota bacterium]
STVALDDEVIEHYGQHHTQVTVPVAEVDPEETVPPPEPHEIQREALAALEDTRAQGYKAGLVVLATGLGKTWLSAFDSARPEFRRVLFVAHREEILLQAMATYRRIRPQAHLGFYNGQGHDPHAEVLFASVQTLSRMAHLQRFDPGDFDYVVIDEFHHATARTYRRLIDYFEPKFTLGLTATPQRMDGGDLLALCQYNRVYRCDIPRAIQLDLLCPFHYFGVPDDVDYDQIPWRNHRFDTEVLTQHWATQQRAQNALEQYQQKAGTRTLAFCCSVEHANFMRDFFLAADVRAAAVHSGQGADGRALSLEGLAQGTLDIVFAVDIFNEGIDVPEIDTVFMLRPTESKILWLQQLGRGLRWVEGKVLQVIDYIGNHRAFRIKPEVLFEVLMGIGPGRGEVAKALEKVRAGEVELPPGCAITYELETLDILEQIVGPVPDLSALEIYYSDFRSLNGRRPDAVELFNAGYNPNSLAPQTWLQFVGLQEPEWQARHRRWLEGAIGQFLETLERTQMTKSYKMLVLGAMLNEDCLPGAIGIDKLISSVVRLARRSPVWQRDMGVDLDYEPKVRKLLIDNPIAVWCGGRGTGGTAYFSFEENVFRFLVDLPEQHREDFQEWVREILDWRLAEYVSRTPSSWDAERIVCRVFQSNGKPILKLPNGCEERDEPWDWTSVGIEGQAYQANFVKIAVNVLRREGRDVNALPDVLREWFGEDAGQPGTRFQVAFVREEGRYRLEPLDYAQPIRRRLN